IFPCYHPPTPAIYPLSLHDALPILLPFGRARRRTHAMECRWRRFAQGGALPDCVPVVAATVLRQRGGGTRLCRRVRHALGRRPRSEEHTSELQSRFDLVCRLLLEKK